MNFLHLALLSEELKQNVVRKRSVQLLTNVVKHMHAALKLEELMSSLFNTTDHDSHANYTEAATRVFCALKVKFICFFSFSHDNDHFISS